MSEPDHIIGTALRELADEATPPRLNAGALWRAGRQRRWAVITTSVAGAAAAAALIPLAVLGAVANPAPAPGSPSTDRLPPIHFPIQLRQVARVADSRCAPGSHGLPGISKDKCFYFTQAGMTVSRFASVKITRVAGGPTTGLPVPAYVLNFRLQRADIRPYADLTQELVNQHSPRDQLAIIANGMVISHPDVVNGVFILRPYIITAPHSGIFQLGAWYTGAQIKAFLHRLEQHAVCEGKCP